MGVINISKILHLITFVVLIITCVPFLLEFINRLRSHKKGGNFIRQNNVERHYNSLYDGKSPTGAYYVDCLKWRLKHLIKRYTRDGIGSDKINELKDHYKWQVWDDYASRHPFDPIIVLTSSNQVIKYDNSGSNGLIDCGGNQNCFKDQLPLPLALCTNEEYYWFASRFMFFLFTLVLAIFELLLGIQATESFVVFASGSFLRIANFIVIGVTVLGVAADFGIAMGIILLFFALIWFILELLIRFNVFKRPDDNLVYDGDDLYYNSQGNYDYGY